MVMEFMDGDSLAQRIRQRGSIAPADLYPIARQLLDALGAAHAAGIVHRDLKPDNVFLLRSRRGQPDFVKLLDFGISKFSTGPGGLSMTRTGAVMGTPYYMAPEQAKGAKDIDHRVDIYAAGVILYEALAGRVPFLADTFNELLFKIVLEKPDPLAKVAPHVDPVLAGIIETTMARDPAERFQTTEALRDALDHWASQQGHHAPKAPAVAPLPTAQPVAATGGSSMLGSTPGNWAGASAVDAVAPPLPKSNTGMIAGIVAAVVVLAAGALLLLTRGSHESAVAPAASEPATTQAPTAPPAPAPAPTPAASAEPSAPAPVVSVASATPETRSSATAAPAPAPAPAPAKVVHKSTTASPSRPAPAPAAKPAPKPEPPSQPSSGRKIRQSL
jgi:serine/threonine-protein kinase